MGERIRAKDWSKTPLGDAQHWPQSLKTCVRIVLTSRQPMFVWWGRELINIYNDAYKAIVGGKHPRALGQPASEVWNEIWDEAVGPRAHTVMTKNEGTYDEALLLIMERNGYPEETYYTFSYSPVPGDNGGTDGIICANTDDTQRITNARQLRTLTELGKSVTGCKSNEELFENTIRALQQNPRDFPFAFLYEINKEGDSARFAGATSPLPPDMVPPALRLDTAEASPWQLQEMISTGKIVVVDQLIARLGELPRGAWPRSPEKALVIPILQSGQKLPLAVLVVGLNPFRQPDDSYLSFFQLLADQIATSLVSIYVYEEERRRAEALAEIDKAKTAFFSNVSHEFRTPLTLMLGPLEELINESNGPLSAPYKTSVESTHRNAMRLLRLVNTLLDFSRIEADRIQAHFYPVDLCRFTTDLAGSFQSIIESAGLQFDVDCRDAMEKVYVDREMWEKIVFNLLSNAFKYTLKGSIAISLREENGQAILRVRDTGVGIPAAELPRMFERFHRVQNSAGRTHEGTGIGLSLVKELVKIHHGNIRVESVEGLGSTFTVTIPLGKSHLPPSHITDKEEIPYESTLSGLYLKEAVSLTRDEFPLPETTEAIIPAEKPVILVVDDNADMRDYIKRLLDRQYTVETAVHGRQALDKLPVVQPDLVISDVMMPVMDGMELLHNIKSAATTTTLPVILLSARAGEEAKIEGYDSGADDYLVKPFSARELLARVRSQIKIARSRDHVEQQLRNLFMDAPMATCILRGPGFIIEVANDPILEIWGRTAAEVMHKKVVDALPEVEGQGFIDLLNHVYRTGERFVSSETPIALYRKGVLENIYIRFVYEALREEDGSISGVMVVANDITDLVEARHKVESQSGRLEQKVAERTQELKQANEQLEKSNHELEQFAYIASHDLQEPLRKIQVFSGLLEANLHDSTLSNKYIDKISTSATRMTNLIRDVLNYSRLSQVNAGFEPVDLNSVLQNVVTDFELLIAEKNARIESDPLPVVKGLFLQFHQLFSNLVGNSLKFSDTSPVIKITADRLSPEEAQQVPGLNTTLPWVRIVFRDNGIGFEQQYAEQIFTIFQRLNNRRFGGTGIGLALCKKIVENHHGMITASSQPGAGAAFTVYLPA